MKELVAINKRLESQKQSLGSSIKTLKQQQQEAQGFSRERIPKRRFGASVVAGRQRQQNVLATRQRAKAFISEKQQQIESLEERQESLSESQQTINQNIRQLKRAKRQSRSFAQSQSDKLKAGFASGQIEQTGQGIQPTTFGAATSAGAVASSSGGGFLDLEGNEFFVSGQSSLSGQQFEKTTFIPAQVSTTDNEALRGVISAQPKLPFLERQQRRISLSRGTTGKAGVLSGLALGVTSGVISVATLGRNVFTQPKTTAKGIFIEAPKSVISGVFTGKGFPGVGAALSRDPAFATGRIGFELAFAKGTQAAILKSTSLVERAQTFTALGKGVVRTADTGERFIVGVPGFKAIGIIPEGKGLLKGGVPTQRGAFGFTKKEQLAFGGVTGGVGTTAKGLFGKFTKRTVTVTKGEGDFGLFATPPQTIKKLTKITEGLILKKGETIPIVRESRIAPVDKPARLLDIISGDISLRKTKPQFVIFKEQTIGKNFKGIGFAQSSELETTLAPGKIIKKVNVPGQVFLKGRRVEIIAADIKEGQILKGLTSPKVTRETIKTPNISNLESTLGLRPSRRVSPTSIVTRIVPRRGGSRGGLRGSSPTQAARFEPVRITPRTSTPPRRGGGGSGIRLNITPTRIPTPTTRLTPPPVRIGRPPPLRPRAGKKTRVETQRARRLRPLDEGLFISADLTSRAIGKIRVIKTKDLVKVASAKTSGLELRGIPKIV